MIDIPISTVRLGADEERLVLEVLRSGHLAQGPMVARLEAGFADVARVRHVVAVSSGTTALVAALQALEVGPGQEVVTSPFTFVATLNAILEVGAAPRFADISLRDFCMDPERVADACTSRTRVLMPVHLYGQPADMGRLVPIAQERSIAVVEDAAQAHGAELDGRAVGSFGLGCFSLYATKNVTTGEGGLVTTDDEALADRLRLLRNQGMRNRYEYEVPGHNYRLTDLQAAVGIPQLERLATTTSARQQNAARLSEGLADIPGLITPEVMPGRTHVFHQYTVRVTEEARIGRDELASRLTEAGIGTGIYYPRPVYDYDCYRDHPALDLIDTPNADRAGREVLSLPVHPALADTDLDRIVASVRKLLA